MDFGNIWCWIIPLLVGAICGYLGYLWGKRNGTTIIDNSNEIQELKERNDKLHADLTSCNHKVIELENAASLNLKAKSKKPSKTKGGKTSSGNAKNNLAISALTSIQDDTDFNAELVKKEYGKRVKFNDLKVVEGIGPKIEGLFKDAGIDSWQALAEATLDTCQDVLKSGGDRYKLHDPGSWPLQAKMAFNGEWKALAKWQEEHKGGKL